MGLESLLLSEDDLGLESELLIGSSRPSGSIK